MMICQTAPLHWRSFYNNFLIFEVLDHALPKENSKQYQVPDLWTNNVLSKKKRGIQVKQIFQKKAYCVTSTIFEPTCMYLEYKPGVKGVEEEILIL